MGAFKARSPKDQRTFKSYMALSEEQRAELAKQADVELNTGLELIVKDKKTIQELITLFDPPRTR